MATSTSSPLSLHPTRPTIKPQRDASLPPHPTGSSAKAAAVPVLCPILRAIPTVSHSPKAMQKGGRAREGNPNAPLASYPPSLVFGAILNCQTSPSAHEAVVGSAHPFLAVRPTRTWCARTYMPGKGPPPASNLVHGVHHSRIGYEGCDGRNNVNGSLK